MFQGFYGLLTVLLCVLFAIVVVLFNIAPITYIVFSIAILLSVFLQYRRFKKQSISKFTKTEFYRVVTVCTSKRVVKDTYNSTENHRLYVFVDDGNTKRPHFVELLISNDGTRAVFYQSK